MISREDAQTYLTFIYNVVVPRGGADQFYVRHGASISRTAAVLRKKFQFTPQKLYRGILLDPQAAASGRLDPADFVQYLSFSESRAVACEFADINHPMSDFVRARTPHFRGYMIEHTPAPSEVLFHHSWAERLGLHNLGLLHWDQGAVQHQREVVLRQTGLRFSLVPASVTQSRHACVA